MYLMIFLCIVIFLLFFDALRSGSIVLPLLVISLSPWLLVRGMEATGILTQGTPFNQQLYTFAFWVLMAGLVVTVTTVAVMLLRRRKKSKS